MFPARRIFERGLSSWNQRHRLNGCFNLTEQVQAVDQQGPERGLTADR